jgi:hypothetical protein
MVATTNIHELQEGSVVYLGLVTAAYITHVVVSNIHH